MFDRLYKLLLLACFTFWGSGAAMYSHERLEDDEAEGSVHVAAQSGSCDNARVAGVSSGEHDGHHHDHDACPVCQMLALMKAFTAVPPVPPVWHPAAVAHVLPLCCQQSPSVFCLPNGPIRGPPSISSYL